MTKSYDDLFDWLIQALSDNDAGYFHALKLKGKPKYLRHTKTCKQRVSRAQNLDEALTIYRDWLKFFREQHLAVLPYRDPAKRTSQPDPSPVTHWPEVACSEELLRARLNALSDPGFEGIWYSQPYTVGIVKQGAEYHGFIIDAGDSPWRQQQLKLKIMPAGKDGRFRALCYLRDYGPYQVEEVELLGNHVLELGSFRYTRQYPYSPAQEEISAYYQMLDARQAILKPLNKQSTLLYLPSFIPDLQNEIEDLIESNVKLLSHSRNLIIDVRNNGGGSTQCFQKLLPYLYTNPMSWVGWDFRSSKANISMFRQWGAFEPDNDTAEAKKAAKAALQKAKAGIGELIDLYPEESNEVVLPETLKYPRQIAVLMNGRCASATEAFLLMARQSRKTKLFGLRSKGSFDISNMNRIVSPCKRIELHFAMTINKNLEQTSIDGIGIMPDFLIPDSIPEYRWVQYVQGILEAKNI